MWGNDRLWGLVSPDTNRTEIVAGFMCLGLLTFDRLGYGVVLS